MNKADAWSEEKIVKLKTKLVIYSFLGLLQLL